MHELSLHVLDLVQNALEAEASTIWVEITEDRKQDKLILRVIDDGRGMDAQTAAAVTDPFVTTRKTRKVGLGLPLIDMTARQAGGDLRILSKPGEGTTIEASYRLSHWDRPPLGNIADTVKTIIIANPDINFHYCHCVDSQTFSVCTRDLKEILGDVPLTHPDVLRWLDTYLKENTANMYGGVQDENR